jgi:hypothetical protein
VPLTRSGDPVEVPDSLRRSDGSSVYTVTGSQLFTSPDLLAAEARIVARAGQHDGMVAPARPSTWPCSPPPQTGLPLNAGQAALVREMATSGARLQLAIAPAGAGKTTAMRALAGAWTEAGGTVLGLAPSAAAARRPRREHRGHRRHHGEADLAPGAPRAGQRYPTGRRPSASHLVIIDEAGMADTLSLDKVVDFVIARGGSVRLIGDDQQLAAVGAGGVLRDIQATHGCLHLSELMRFADPAEGAASLALREGLPEALGFYLDRDRVHVGDLATMTDDVFTAWQTDHAAGADAIMLAPTRDLVCRAQPARPPAPPPPHPSPPTAAAHPRRRQPRLRRDTVITRSNDRTLRVTATDWVKNGDRWHVTAVGDDGTVTVQHARNGRIVDLPAAYVATSVELGYACTIHTAQGVTADASYTLLTGLSHANWPTRRPPAGASATTCISRSSATATSTTSSDPTTPTRTATDLLERYWPATPPPPPHARCAARPTTRPTSWPTRSTATWTPSTSPPSSDSAPPRSRASTRPQTRSSPTSPAPMPGPHCEPTCCCCRRKALTRSTSFTAATMREVDTAGDVASVLDWRLDDTGLRSAGTAPCRGFPASPRPSSTTRSGAPTSPPGLPAYATCETRSPNRSPPPQPSCHPGPAKDKAALSPNCSSTSRCGVRPCRSTRQTAAPPAPPNWPRHPTAGSRTEHTPRRQPHSRPGRVGRRLSTGSWSTHTRPVLPVARRTPRRDLPSRLDAPAMVRRALAEGALPDDHNAAACGGGSPGA